MEENKRAAGRLNEIRQRRIRNRRMIVGISFVVFAFCIVMGIQMVQKNSNLKIIRKNQKTISGRKLSTPKCGILWINYYFCHY